MKRKYPLIRSPKKAVIAAWREIRKRKGCEGRLYWRGHPAIQFDRGVICKYIDHPLVTEFFTWAAIWEWLGEDRNKWLYPDGVSITGENE